MLLRTFPVKELNVSEDEDAMASLGTLFQTFLPILL